MEEHILHVDEILTNLTDAGITLQINKYRFFQPQVEYLGHMVMLGCLKIYKTNMTLLLETQTRRTKQK